MMNTINKLQETGIVAVIRAQNGDEAVKIARAVKKGGIKGLEITMTVPGAVDVISELSKEFEGEEIIIGAGSVLDAETARTCIQAGAEYIVSPSFNEEMVKLANRYQKPVIPGAMTVTEVVKAMEAGADLVKIFPASLFGPKIIKAIKGPVPQAPLLPTGGVSLDNVAEWIKAGSAAVGVGSSLTAGAKTGDFDKVTQTAAAFVEKIAKAREV